MSAYACTADTGSKGRCRNNAKEGDDFCQLHAKLRDAGTVIKKVGPPDKVLVKANINPRWLEKFTSQGVPLRTANFSKQEAAHVADAQRVGRQAYAVRKNVADSGVPVFGKDGLQNALTVEAFEEICRAYRLTDLHIFERRDRGLMYVLCLTFEKGEGEKKDLPADVAEFFAMSKWGFAHIWANPPKEDGTVVNTVNLSHRSDEAAKWSLEFANGLWTVTPC